MEKDNRINSVEFIQNQKRFFGFILGGNITSECFKKLFRCFYFLKINSLPFISSDRLIAYAYYQQLLNLSIFIQEYLLKMSKKIIIIFLQIFLTSQATQASLPNWYSLKPKDSNLYIYEIGEGKTKEDAVVDALNNLSGKINLKITNGQSNEGHNINFPEYFIKELLKSEGINYILISFNKNEFLQLQINNLFDEEKILDNKLKKIKRKNDLLKLKDYNDIYRVIDNIKSKISIIKAIGDFDDSKYKKTFRNIDSDYSEFLKSLNISIKLKDSRLLPIYKDIKEYFTRRSIEVKHESDNIFAVEIDENSEYLYNTYLISSNVKFLLKNHEEILLYDSVDTQCSSAISYEDCFEKILFQVREMFANNEEFFKYD
jgi:hypothetical protein